MAYLGSVLPTTHVEASGFARRIQNTPEADT